MKLTTEIAKNNVGKYLDVFNRHASGEYPIQIIQYPDGNYGYKRVRSGVCSLIDEESTFNAVYFDYYFEDLKEVD